MIPAFSSTLIRPDPERRLLEHADAGGVTFSPAELRYLAAVIELLRQDLAAVQAEARP